MTPRLSGWLGRLAGREGTGQPSVVSQRFIDVFRLHGVAVSQIPRLLPQIKLSDLQPPERVLDAVTPELLDQVATLFGVRTSWLEGIDDQIYEFLGSEKRPKVILEHINAVLADETSLQHHPLRILATTKKLDRHGKDFQHLAPVVMEKIAELGEESIYRYSIYREGFFWKDQSSRIELKTLARIVFKKLGITVPLYEISERDMNKLLEGQLVPGFLRNVYHQSTPSLEDYALSTSESVIARETDELEDVLRYIEENGLSTFLFFKAPVESPSQQDSGQTASDKVAESVRANAVRAANKKHERTNAIKGRFVAFYRDHGSEHESRTAAAKTFYNRVLDEKDQLAFTSAENAQRAFLTELRKADSKRKP